MLLKLSTQRNYQQEVRKIHSNDTVASAYIFGFGEKQQQAVIDVCTVLFGRLGSFIWVEMTLGPNLGLFTFHCQENRPYCKE